MDKTISNTIENLKNNGFKVEFFDDVYIAKEKILKEIEINEDIGIGGSMTIYNMNLHKDLINRGNNVFWHWLVNPENRNEERNKAQNASVYLSSTNSITEDGKLINIDGLGNRVASMFYGHDRTFIIAGVNKIAKNSEEAIKRIKEEACPKNAERLDLKTPCRYTGKCNECDSSDRMCRVTVTIEKNPMQGNISIYLINDKLGY
ncbi:lactate utilization protein [Sporosalibacterium faouarense]|uniref:lactate utilization protein n=1 Tax=Sporosalibacterium faouarense TaxID=516123 RepID=UPI00141D1B8F|nr:lactate utilization protein [Sporosalibacterium faouarense]MTI49238.1 lactate utilization protein [Bacillota bacterium]